MHDHGTALSNLIWLAYFDWSDLTCLI